LLRAEVKHANPHYDPSRRHHTPAGFRNNYSNPPPQDYRKWQRERKAAALPYEPPGGWRFPLDRPDIGYLASNGHDITVTWIGHATVLLQIAGVNVLTDPHFSARASPVTFAGPQRRVAPGIALADLPRIDVVLVSHNHYDHLDAASVRELARQRGGPPRFYVPLGVRAFVERRGIPIAAEMDWWDVAADGPLDVHFVPAQHWSARTLRDRNRTLWGGFVVEANGFRFIYTGDTGYSKDFADIGGRFGAFDLAVIPIGAYAPRWFMANHHVDPAEAVQIHRDLRAARSLAVHWGTFVLTDEPLDEPPRRLAEALDAAGVPRDEFWVFRHGEMRVLGSGRGKRARTRSRAERVVPP
jgi:L-ascorbate metabolism protein UlaG (beta-lactamase superfamily)